MDLTGQTRTHTHTQSRSVQLSDRTADLLGLCDTKRWVVVRTIRDQSVAAHSFAVAIIAMELAERLIGLSHPADSDMGLLLVWALVHDAPETLTGDIDGKFKRDYPGVAVAVKQAEFDAFPWYKDTSNNTPMYIREIVRAADKIETVAFIRARGIGVRADDIYRELLAIIDRETIPSLAKAIGMPEADVSYIVHTVINCSVGESNCIQLRRHRTAGK